MMIEFIFPIKFSPNVDLVIYAFYLITGKDIFPLNNI